jgi:hypothetical protein
VLLDWLRADAVAHAALGAQVIAMPDAEPAQLLGELEEAGCVASAAAPLQ